MAKETYYLLDLVEGVTVHVSGMPVVLPQWQKRPTIMAKETYYLLDLIEGVTVHVSGVPIEPLKNPAANLAVEAAR
jgi:hypothetical protein